MSELVSSVHGWTGNKASRMFGTQLFKFRFRGKISQIMNLYECFRLCSEENKNSPAMHPVTLAKLTGIPFGDIAERLQEIPEIFIKLPKRDGITRYRLSSVASNMTSDEMEEQILKAERNETLLFYSMGGITLVMLLLVIFIVSTSI